ncbi:MAG: DUF3108 domain-containing protein [Gammaproteobacteria bacterium]|nr:DUF3108 domain-containing protein [Gammaproteobacteria bacterium]
MPKRTLPRVLRRAAVLWLLPLASLAAPSAPLDPFDAKYTVRAKGFKVAEMTLSLQRDGEARFLYRARTRAAGLLALFRDDRVDEQSLWIYYEGSIRPLRYRYDHTGRDEPRHVRLRFHWERGVVENTVSGDSWRMDIPPGTLDKLAIQLAVMLDLRRGERALTYPIADGGKLKTYRFEIVGRERVETPAGEYQTVKLRRQREDDDERVTHFWCAPTLGFLPVQVEHMKKGKGTAHMTLESVRGL